MHSLSAVVHSGPGRGLPCAGHRHGNDSGSEEGWRTSALADCFSFSAYGVGLNYEVMEKEMNGGKNYETPDRLTRWRGTR